MKNRAFPPVRTALVPVIYGCAGAASLAAARALATEVVLVGLVPIGADESLSAGTTKAREVRRQLRELALLTDPSMRVKSPVHVSTTPWRDLETVLEAETPDALVLDWYGHLAALGVAPDEVLLNPACDIILVRGPFPEKPRRVLVPARGGPHAELALRLALSLSPEKMTTLHLTQPGASSDAPFRGLEQVLRRLPEVDRAVVVGLSLGAQYATRLASLHPERVLGLVLIGPSLPLSGPMSERAGIVDNFLEPYPENPEGWDKYNLAYWHADYPDFVEFFFSQAFNEPHSTKPREDAVGWALEGGPESLEAEAKGNPMGLTGEEIFAAVTCPTLVIHGTDDRIQSHRVGVEAARLSNGTLASLGGSGHIPNVRDPVRVNLLLREFVERLIA